MIKRFNPDFSLSISHELAYMRETPEGGYVEHGDYATLFSELELVKADRDALAVENAELIEALRCIYTTALIAQDSGPEIFYSWDFANQPAEEIEMWISDAKETDAALAGIEARVWAEAKDLANSMLASDSADHIDFLFDGKIQQLREAK